MLAIVLLVEHLQVTFAPVLQITTLHLPANAGSGLTVSLKWPASV